jgi:hypothetical protein
MDCRHASKAGYQHSNREGCLKGTRESVLNEIERWTLDFNKSPVFWLNGLTGTGKSAIARTIAERIFADGRFGASFFCSRDVTDHNIIRRLARLMDVKDRSDLHLIFPTLAHQLARQYPEFRSSLIPLLQSNPKIVHKSLHDQMQQLLVKPLLSANISTVIVIDALDVCRDEDQESAILHVLGQLVPKLPRVKFFITSRPEPHIMARFRDPLLAKSTNVFILHNVEPDTVDDNIRCFFKYELSELAHRREIDDWPTSEELDVLCQRTAGFFPYAAATVKFLKSSVGDPRRRLREIVNPPEGTTRGGRAGLGGLFSGLKGIKKSPEGTTREGKARLKGYSSLNSLYASTLQAAFPENDDSDTMARSILSAVILATTPLSQPALATLTGFGRNEIQRVLELIQSILVLPKDPNHPVRPFHQSFPDFITDPTCCTDKRFYISPDYHTKLALRCLKLIAKSMENVDPAPGNVWMEESGVREAVEYA